MPLRQILLIEDNADDAELIQRALRRARVANPVAWVDNGPLALDWLHRTGPHTGRADEAPLFVMLDVKLPGMGGHEVLAAIRADPDPGIHLLPVVMLTSSNQDSDRLRGYSNGANAYVVKPVEFTELLRAVEALGYFWGIINQPPPTP